MDDILSKIIELCDKPKTLEELYPKLKTYKRSQVKKAFNLLVSQNKLMQEKSKRYAVPKFFGLIEAKFCSTDKGYGFAEPFEPLPSARDVFLPAKNTKNAWHGDKILVRLHKSRFKSDKRREKQSGEIVKILERQNSTINGTLCVSEDVYFVQPDIKKYPIVLLEEQQLSGANLGDKIAVKLKFYGNKNYMPHGEVCSIFGQSDTLIAGVNSILHSHGISREFPQMVQIQTESISKAITTEMFGNRLNLTDEIIFTIDGDYSKDFDDAVSLKPLTDGTFELGIHIADVSHYVTEGSPLDLEAFDRATSVYFANDVVPMLPFELSNGICSLNPNENRFAMSIILKLDENANILDKSFHKSVINSKYRLTYNNVNKILDSDAKTCEKYSEITDILFKMNSFAEKMEQKRLNRGYLDLDIPECYIITDENREPIDVKLRQRGKSEKLIEQFMVLANETVAEYMSKNEFPAIYRVHEPPNMEKLTIFAEISRLFGHKIKNDQLSDPISLQKVLNDSKNSPHHKVVATMLLRSLSRARYDEKNIGHNGLASEFYLHFTSPIRRYPDLVVHRMLSKKIDNENFTKSDTDYVEMASTQSTSREKHADEASRDIEKLYFAKYMSQFVGQTFEASVSGVQNFGIFVELNNTIEGLIRIDALADDHYSYDDEKLRLIGKNTGKIYTIGTKLCVKLVNATVSNGQIDFIVGEK